MQAHEWYNARPDRATAALSVEFFLELWNTSRDQISGATFHTLWQGFHKLQQEGKPLLTLPYKTLQDFTPHQLRDFPAQFGNPALQARFMDVIHDADMSYMLVKMRRTTIHNLEHKPLLTLEACPCDTFYTYCPSDTDQRVFDRNCHDKYRTVHMCSKCGDAWYPYTAKP